MNNNITLDTNVDDLDLSVRSWNCLKNMGVKTVRDISLLTAAQLLKRNKNFGKKSLKEIQEATGFPRKEPRALCPHCGRWDNEPPMDQAAFMEAAKKNLLRILAEVGPEFTEHA